MKHNVGSYDAGIRFVGGCAIMFIGVHQESWWGLIGVFPWLTAAFAFCPLYVPFHLDTTGPDERPVH